MNHPPMPSDLAAKLRVTASHERARRLARVSFGSRWHQWSISVQLWFDNLMRPVALPFSGGLASALVLFSLLVPSLSFSHNFDNDMSLFTDPAGEVVVMGPSGPYVPMDVFAAPRIENVNAAYPAGANVVWLTVDENGKVIDYSVAQGKLTPDLASIIMLSQFRPATYLGAPTLGVVKIVQRMPIPGIRS
jgi:hypothetical protein